MKNVGRQGVRETKNILTKGRKEERINHNYHGRERREEGKR